MPHCYSWQGLLWSDCQAGDCHQGAAPTPLGEPVFAKSGITKFGTGMFRQQVFKNRVH